MTATNYTLLYRKCWEARFLSHLDLIRAIHRWLRRSSFPLSYTQGYNPRPIVSFLTPPLPVGYTSENECIRFSLTKDIAEETTLHILKKHSPPGLIPVGCSKAEKGLKKIEVKSTDFIIFVRFPPEADLKIPQKISLSESVEASRIEWESVDASVVFSSRKAASKLRSLFNAQYSCSIPSSSENFRPEKQVRSSLPLTASIHVHRKISYPMSTVEKGM
ncbi:MAG: TIGR03936 family radical SAM-associated protein [bacterium]